MITILHSGELFENKLYSEYDDARKKYNEIVKGYSKERYVDIINENRCVIDYPDGTSVDVMLNANMPIL